MSSSPFASMFSKMLQVGKDQLLSFYSSIERAMQLKMKKLTNPFQIWFALAHMQSLLTPLAVVHPCLHELSASKLKQLFLCNH